MLENTEQVGYRAAGEKVFQYGFGKYSWISAKLGKTLNALSRTWNPPSGQWRATGDA